MTRLLHPTAEGAALIGVGRSTLYELIKSGEIKTVKIGRRTLIPHDELVRFVSTLTGGAASGDSTYDAAPLNAGCDWDAALARARAKEAAS